MKNLKTLSIVMLLLLAVAILSSCQKEPTACIHSSATTCIAGDKVTFTSCSTDADHVKWTFDDGQTSTAKSVDFTFNNSGSKTIKLEAFSKNGKKTDEASASVTVVAATGKVTFWNTNSSYYINVTINGITHSIDNVTIASDCGQSGYANFTLNVGTYHYTATELDDPDGNYTWSGNVTITKDGCLLMQLY